MLPFQLMTIIRGSNENENEMREMLNFQLILVWMPCGECGAGPEPSSVYNEKRYFARLFINFYGPGVRTRGIPQYTASTPAQSAS